MNSFSNLFKQMMGSQVQSPETQDPQPKLYPTIVSLPSNSTHSIVASNDTHMSMSENHYLQLAANPSPHIEITPASRPIQTRYANYYQSNYHESATYGHGVQEYPPHRYYLSHFSIPENSFCESYGSYSEGSLTFSPPQATSDPELGFLDHVMQARSFQELISSVEPLAQVDPPKDFVIGDVFEMDDDEQNPNGHLIAPGSFEMPPYMPACNSDPALPVETLVTTSGSMASASPNNDELSCLSPYSPLFSDTGLSNSTYSSPYQPFLSPSSRSLDVPGYALTRTASGGKARKPPGDLILIEGPNGERRYQCKSCSHTSTRPNNLREHQLKHDPNRPKRFQCLLCERPFARKNDLKRHWQIHFKGESTSLPEYKAFLMAMLDRSLIPNTAT